MRARLVAFLAMLAYGASADIILPEAITLTPDAPHPFSSAYYGVEASLFGVEKVDVSDLGLPFKTAFRLTGRESSRIQLGQPEALDISGEMALSAWICPSETNGYRNIVSRDFRFSPNREIFLRIKDGRLEFGIWGNGDCTVSVSYEEPLNTWIHVLGTYTGSSFDLYLNGDLVASVECDIGPEVFDSNWSIGRHSQNGQRAFLGLIGDVTFHRGAIDSSMAEFLYQSALSGVHASGVKGVLESDDEDINVVDDIGPVITVPTYRQIPYTNTLQWSFAATNDVQVVDNGTDDPAVWIEDFEPSLLRPSTGGGIRHYVRTWYAEDDSANFTNVDEVVDIVKLTPPQLTLPVDASLVHEDSRDPAQTGTPAVEDDNDEFPTIVDYEDVFDSAIGVGLVFDRLMPTEPIAESVVDDIDIDTSKPFSISATIKVNSFDEEDSIRTIVSRGPRFSPSYEVYMRIVGKNYVFGYWNGYDYSITVPADEIADARVEVTLTGTFDGRTLKLYKNGELVGSRLMPLGFVKNRVIPWGIGKPSNDTYANDRKLRGELHRVGLWNRCLGAFECDALAKLSRVPVGEVSFSPSCPEGTTTRTILREWMAEDAFGNVTNAFQRLQITGSFLDGDDDGLCGYLEEVYGTNPNLADTDSDGLSDNIELFSSYSNPLLPDSDSDRLPDDWEFQYGFDPIGVEETYQDTDKDGLVNLLEYWLGTNPLIPDTDGDGVVDGMEFFSAVADPSVADFSSEARVVGDPLAPSEFVSADGAIRSDEGEVYSAGTTGTLEWDLTVSEGANAIAFDLAADNSLVSSAGFSLILSVDGKFAGRSAAYFGGPNRLTFYLPDHITPGAHRFSLVWHAMAKTDGAYLRISSIVFVSHPRTGAAAAALMVRPLTEYVSPCCIEAHTPYRSAFFAELCSPVTNVSLTAKALPNFGFSVDVDLPNDGSSCDVVFSDGVSSVTSSVSWAACPIGTVEELMIRVGDSLRLAGPEVGEVELIVEKKLGEGWCEEESTITTEPWPYKFGAAGTYRITARTGDDTSSCMIVEVVSSSFPQDALLTMLAEPRTLDCPQLDARCSLVADEMLKMATEQTDAGIAISVSAPLEGDYAVVTRLPNRGAICDTLRVTPLYPDNGLYYSVVETYSDGTELIEVYIWLSHMEEEVRVACEPFVAGVTLDDGSKWRVYTAQDFDALGNLTVRFLKAPGVKTSVCHRTYIYQNDEEIYNNRWR